MKILITGNLGYVGPVVCRHLRKALPGATLVGYDTGYFTDCCTVKSLEAADKPHEQITGDMRDISPAVLQGFDAVLHLAALSNDPMGQKFERVTQEVNLEASVRLGHLAKEQGVRHFVFASSCSVYGLDDGSLKTEESQVQPLTAYARSKIGTEEALQLLANDRFVVTALRFATACGFSPRCRLDLVLNDFVASALSTGKITLLSDGTPWRPLIHVQDMARAMEWALSRRTDQGGDFLAVNAGSDTWNYQVRELAEAVAEGLGGLPVELNAQSGPDKRSYRVDFRRFRELAPHHQPQWHLASTVEELRAGLLPVIQKNMVFRDSAWIRLRVLSQLMDSGKLGADLRWLSADC